MVSDSRLDRITAPSSSRYFRPKADHHSLSLGNQVIGFIQGYFGERVEFIDEDVRVWWLWLAGGDCGSISIVAQSGPDRARQEQRIREVTAQVFSATDVDSIMRRAVEQIGKVLGVPAYIYLGEPATVPAASKPSTVSPPERTPVSLGNLVSEPREGESNDGKS
jgi:hypothetical protein